MRTTLTLIAAFLVLAVPASAGAPRFSKSYHGSITGHKTVSQGDTTTTSDWTVKGVRFKLYKVRLFEGGYTGFYAPTAGTVTFREKKTGPCTYSFEKSFALKTAIQSRREAVPFYLDKSPLARFTYDANLRPKKRYEVTETCKYPDYEPPPSQETIEVPELMRTGARRGLPGRRLTGKYVYKDDFSDFKKSTTYRWDLKP